MRRIITTMLLCTGCAGANVDTGLQYAQKGLAVVDVGTEVQGTEYVDAVRKIRAHCAGDQECEARYHVTDQDVEQARHALETLSATYDAMVVLLAELEAAWGGLAPALKNAKGVADGLATE